MWLYLCRNHYFLFLMCRLSGHSVCLLNKSVFVLYLAASAFFFSAVFWDPSLAENISEIQTHKKLLVPLLIVIMYDCSVFHCNEQYPCAYAIR